MDKLKNSDKVLVVGSKNTITYEFQTISEMMANYFQIIEESNDQLLTLINKQRIQSTQYFPVYGFSTICKEISNIEELKKQQKEKIESLIKTVPMTCKGTHTTPQSVLEDLSISQTYKTLEIISAIMNENMDMVSVEEYLRNFADKRTTDYRKMLCAYDFKKYAHRLVTE